LSFLKLFLAALIIAPVSSCGGSLFAVSTELAHGPGAGAYSSDTVFVTFMIVAGIAFVVILAALLLVALPLTLLMNRFGAPSLLRDALLIVLAVAGATGFLVSLGQAFPGAWQIGLGYGLLTALLWIFAVRLLTRPRAASQEQHVA
jgi:hypothetical protein